MVDLPRARGDFAMMVVSFSILARLIAPVEMGGVTVLLLAIWASRVIICHGVPRAHKLGLRIGWCDVKVLGEPSDLQR